MSIPGGSAQHEYERRQALRDRRLRQNWGRFAGLAKALSNEPQSTTAWAKGAEGERTTARILEENAGEEVTFLHDLGVPRSSANIDHIAVIGSHVFVIDSKAWEGTIQIRQVGGFFNSTPRLYVGRRDGTKAIEGLAKQVTVVLDVLAGSGPVVTIHPVFCLVGASWPLFKRPFVFRDTLVTRPTKLAETLRGYGPGGSEEQRAIVIRLTARLRPNS